MLRRALVLISLSSLSALLVLSPATFAVIQGHYSKSPLVIQGHSPIVLLVTDPNGLQIGCTAVPCTSTGSPNYVNTIPTGVPYDESPATYDFALNQIVISHPIVGTWTVQYIGTGTGSFTITATSCPEQDPGDAGNPNSGHDEPGCSSFCGSEDPNLAAMCDPDDKPVELVISGGDASSGQSGISSFYLDDDGNISLPTVSVPEFSAGAALATSGALAGVLLIRAFHSRRPGVRTLV